MIAVAQETGETSPGDSSGLGQNQDAIAPGDDGLGNVKFSELTDIPVSTLEKIKPKIINGEPFKTKHADKLEGWTVKNKLWYKK